MLFEREGDMKYHDHQHFKNAVKIPTKTHDGMFFAIIAAVFAISSGVVWLHDIATMWRMPSW
jgi:hypothetical protein